jgi:oligogalacturonide lyase
MLNLMLLAVAASLPAAKPTARTAAFALEVLPSERRIVRDAVTGAELTFVTTDPEADNNLYFHERSFLSDDSLVLFTSGRKAGGLMGCILATGELVRFATAAGALHEATAARRGNRVFALRGREAVEWTIAIRPSADTARTPSKVEAAERILCTLPAGVSPATALNENSDGRLLSLGIVLADGARGIATINTRTGVVREVCRVPEGSFHGHVQFSRTNPNLLSYAGSPNRLMVVDIRSGAPRAVYSELAGELVTHECWWVRDQMVFCGGHRRGESHVKCLDLRTGETRIVGAGSWWPGGSDSELAKWNWWHPCALDSGRWIAADNWHGDIVIFDGTSTQMHLVTQGHRTYGGGDHPHVGWDRSGTRVVFTSHLLGSSDVCVATIPAAILGRR